MLKSEIAAATEALCNRGWLSETPVDFREALLAHCHWREVDAGQAIQHAGDTTACLTGLARGSTSITIALSTPDTPMNHVAHPGFWFGYAPLFTGAWPRQMSIVARSDVLLAHIGQLALEALLADRPHWWRFVGAVAVVQGNIASNIAGDLMIRDSTRRCIAALLRLADCRFGEAGRQGAIEAPLSQELAAIANLSRTSVSAILHELESEGLITLGYRTVALNATAKLRAMVDDI